MDTLIAQFKSLLGNESYVRTFLLFALVMTSGSLVIGFIGRFAFGKKSVLSQSVSSSIGILFIYAISIVMYSYGLNYRFLTFPLPFVRFQGEYLYFASIAGSNFVTLCGNLLTLIILSFTVNLINRWMPNGKKLFSWFFFRILSVALGMIVYALVNQFFTDTLPGGFLYWAPVILLCILVIMLLVGALKVLVGAVLTTVNPLIAFLYTFFFANVIGKLLTRAMLTTVFLTAIVFALNQLSISALLISTAALVCYIPLVILLLGLWFVVGKLL